MFKKMKDPVSALSHMCGALFAVPVTVLLIIKGALAHSALAVASFAVFGAALFLLYSASFFYHCLAISEKVSTILRRVDHMMIFVLIAGTYTPVCLILLKGPWGFSLFGITWALAIGGIILKLVWPTVPRILSTAIYVIMGWIVVVAFVPLLATATPGEMWLLALGGVTYTLGAVIYAIKWPPIQSRLVGFHEIFHFFVLGGSAFHVALMFCLA